MFPSSSSLNRYRLEGLLNDELPGKNSRDRLPQGRGEITAENLVRHFGDPYDALAAAILIVAVQDIKRNFEARDAHKFFFSAWFDSIATNLEIDPNRFYKLARQASQKSVPLELTR